MMNSVTPRAPRCSVSARFHMRPRVSFGSLAFSKICFAFSPASLGQLDRDVRHGAAYQTGARWKHPTSRTGRHTRRLWQETAEARGWGRRRWPAA
jgi:hypothetical protein